VDMKHDKGTLDAFAKMELEARLGLNITRPFIMEDEDTGYPVVGVTFDCYSSYTPSNMLHITESIMVSLGARACKTTLKRIDSGQSKIKFSAVQSDFARTKEQAEFISKLPKASKESSPKPKKTDKKPKEETSGQPTFM
jgi:hypothetical protein